MEDNAKKFGPIFGFYFGKTPAVVLSDFELVKEAFKSEALSFRPTAPPVNEVRPGECNFTYPCT
jgi:hypothetical protein